MLAATSFQIIIEDPQKKTQSLNISVGDDWLWIVSSV